MPDIQRDRGLGKLIGEAPLTTLADGLLFTEGPLWDPDGWLLFQDLHAERTYRWRPGNQAPTVLREHTGAANGQTFGPDGKIYFCEQNGRRVSRMNRDGTGVEVVAEKWKGLRLNSPNDIVCRPDGVLYFTDPPYGLPSPLSRELPFQGVFSLTRSGQLELVTREGFEKPNGLAFAPDGRTLYVADTAKYHIRRFELDDRGNMIEGSDRVFASMDPGQPGGPDGVKVDREGRVYVAVALGIWAYSPSGELLGILSTPRRPSNLNWTGRRGTGLAITAVDSVHWIRSPIEGLLPPFLPDDLEDS